MRAVIVGAYGAIGSAFVQALSKDNRFGEIHACSRKGGEDSGAVIYHEMDINHESSIRTVLDNITRQGTLDRVIVATGILHHDDGLKPEKSLSMLDPENLARLYAINTIGPAMVAKYALPHLRKQCRSVFAAISARVGSVSDNRLGGWYGYRMAKSALNMFIKSAAIEIKRSNQNAIVLGLHPGTVDTALSKPFQGRVDPEKLFTPERAATQLLDVMEHATIGQSGRLLAWDGSEIQP